jgi:DNA-binding NarL/FixJ family response regulator
MEKKTIVIADDHTLVREMWCLILNSNPGYVVVGEAKSGEEAVQLVREKKPDLVMMDINMAGLTGIEATEIILKEHPQARILGISLHTQPSYAQKMMRKGAMGYVTKSSTREEMFKAIGEVLEGRKYICYEIKDILSEQMITGNAEQSAVESLTRRELEVVDMIRRGMSSKEIAAEMFVSVKTVEVHRYNILRKLKLRNSAALVNFILKQAPIEA